MTSDILYFKPVSALTCRDLNNDKLARLITKSTKTAERVFLVQTFEESPRFILFSTKQRLISNTAYFCSADCYETRKYSGVQVHHGNNVKRVISKSDIKFIAKFHLLLDPQWVYFKAVNRSSILLFRLNEIGGISMHKYQVNSEVVDLETGQDDTFGCRLPAFSPPLGNTENVCDRMFSLLKQKHFSGFEGFKYVQSVPLKTPNLLLNLWSLPELSKAHIKDTIKKISVVSSEEIPVPDFELNGENTLKEEPDSECFEYVAIERLGFVVLRRKATAVSEGSCASVDRSKAGDSDSPTKPPSIAAFGGENTAECRPPTLLEILLSNNAALRAQRLSAAREASESSDEEESDGWTATDDGPMRDVLAMLESKQKSAGKRGSQGHETLYKRIKNYQIRKSLPYSLF